LPNLGDRRIDSRGCCGLWRRRLERDRLSTEHWNRPRNVGWRLGRRRRNAGLVVKQSELPERLRRIVREAWPFRGKVELEGELPFARLAGRLKRVGALPSIVELASRAASDERRNASICAALAKEYGHPGIDERAVTAPEIAPRRLSEKQR